MRFACLTIVLFTGTVAFAETTPKDDLIAAAKKLGATGNYAWLTTVGAEAGPEKGAVGEDGALRLGITEGKTAGGVAHVVLERGDDTFEAAFKGNRSIITTPQGWRALPDVAAQRGVLGGGGVRGQRIGGVARMLLGFKAPAAQAQELAGLAADIARTGDTFTAELTEAGAKALLLGGGRGAAGVSVGNPKGKITFWTRDGVLVRYEYTVSGTVTEPGRRGFVEQTATTTVSDIGTTKMTLAPEARLKIP